MLESREFKGLSASKYLEALAVGETLLTMVDGFEFARDNADECGGFKRLE